MEEEPPVQPVLPLTAGDLSRLSVEEIGVRIAALKAEIVRLEAARAQKEASRAAADAVFRLG